MCLKIRPPKAPKGPLEEPKPIGPGVARRPYDLNEPTTGPVGRVLIHWLGIPLLKQIHTHTRTPGPGASIESPLDVKGCPSTTPTVGPGITYCICMHLYSIEVVEQPSLEGKGSLLTVGIWVNHFCRKMVGANPKKQEGIK